MTLQSPFTTPSGSDVTPESHNALALLGMTAKKRSLRLASPPLVVAVAIVLTSVIYILGPKNFTGPDAAQYTAAALGHPSQAPFAYRVLVPAIVRALPFGTEHGFLVVTLASTLSTLLVIYALLTTAGIGHAAALITMTVAGLSYPISYYLWNPNLVDPAANLFLVLVPLFLLQGRYVHAVAAMIIATFVKETSLVILPLLFFDATQHRIRLTVKGTACCLAVATCYATMRATVHAAPGMFDVNSVADLRHLMAYVWTYNVGRYGVIPRVAHDVLHSFGFLWVAWFLGLFRMPRFLAVACTVPVCATLALCPLATDWARVLGMGFPAVVVSSGFFIHSELRDRSVAWVAALIVVAACQVVLNMQVYQQIGLRGRVLYIAATAAVFVAGLFVCLPRWRLQIRTS